MKERVEVRPRDVISDARERRYLEQESLANLGGDLWLSSWSDRQHGKQVAPPVTPEQRREAIDRTVEEKLAEYKAAAGGVLPHKDSISESVAQLLEQCQRVEDDYGLVEVTRLEKSKADGVPAYDLLVRQRAGADEVRTGVVFVPATAANAMFHVLNRLRDDPEPPRRALLVADESGPDLGSKGEEYLEELRQRPGFVLEVLQLPVNDFATLDALHAVWNMARSEDSAALLPNGQTHLVSADEVEASHHRQGRYRSAPVLSELFRVPEPSAPSGAAETMVPTAGVVAATVAAATVAVAEPAFPVLELSEEAEPVFPVAEEEELTIAEPLSAEEDDVINLDDDIIDLE